MNEFVLFFRMDILTKEAQPTPEQMQKYMEQWSEWIESIAIQDKLAIGGNHLSTEGCVVRPNNSITKSPYVEKNESIAGYIIILAKNINEAVTIASGCPILKGNGTSVEVRAVGQ